MGTNRVYDQRLLLFHSAFTCLYIPTILMIMKLNDSIYKVGSFEFIPVLIIIIFIETVKVLFSTMKSRHTGLGELHIPYIAQHKKTWLKNFRELVKFAVSILILFIIYYTMTVLFGAPLFSRYKETTMFSLTLCVLTFVPGCLHLGIDGALAVLTRPHDQGTGLFSRATSLNIKATLFGAWISAIVIPLDWDRPWQVWPLPCIFGAFIGFILGHFVTVVRILPALRLGMKTQR